MGLSNADVLVGLEKGLAIAKERAENKAYAMFAGQLEPARDRLQQDLFTTRKAEVAWHKEIGESAVVGSEAENTYYKWRDMVAEVLPGADLVDWQGSQGTPAEIDVAIETIIAVIEEHAERLDFSEAALEELNALSARMDEELNQDRETYRAYRQAVSAKNGTIDEALALFYRVRRFIRRDIGPHSPEYAQLRDRAVRESRKQQTPPAEAQAAAD